MKLILRSLFSFRLLAVALAALAPLALRAHEDQPKPAHGDHAHGVPVSYETAASAWAAISRMGAELESLVGAKQLDGVHGQTEALAGAFKALVEKSGELSADKKKRLAAAVRQAATMADHLHDAADGAEQKRAEGELKKLRAALSLVEAQLSAAVLKAAKEQPAPESHGAVGHGGDHAHGAAAPATITTQVLPASPLSTGTETAVILRLTDRAGQPVGATTLELAHTKRVHLLIVDASLTDYQHIHPEEVAGRPGDWAFSFTPRAGGTYKLFADLLPKATGAQEYASTEFAVAGATKALVPELNTVTTVDGYRFALSVEGEAPFVAGAATLVKVNISGPDGRPFTALEPLMGAFAHGVGFTADRAGVLHVHPLGKEPEQDHERGGPEMSFHLVPEMAGFLKFFVQVQIGGRDYFAGYGLNVLPAPAGQAAAKPAGAYLCPMACMAADQPGKCTKCGMSLVKRT